MNRYLLIPIVTAFSPIAISAPLLGVTNQVRVRVTVENLSPTQGNYLSSPWIAFHDGTFDFYDDAAIASNSLESMAEDGIPDLLTVDVITSAVSVSNGVLNGPVIPGANTSGSVLLDPTQPTSRYFSYASKLLPSNDAFIGNDDPLAIPIFDNSGVFVAQRFVVTGADVRDAGTEVNDELPANTPFLGQDVPNTGTPESGTITLHPGFNPVGSGGILDDSAFSQGDFTSSGYPIAILRFAAAPAILEERGHSVVLSGANEVSAVSSKAKGKGTFDLIGEGTAFQFKVTFSKLKGVNGAYLQLGAEGEEGEAVVNLLSAANKTLGVKKLKKIQGFIDADDLIGPFTAMPIDVLSAAIAEGNIYLNIQTDSYPGGEIRGQLQLD